MKKIICLVGCLFAGMVNAAIISNNSVSGSMTNDFNGLSTGNVSGVINQSGASYGERFTGQTLSTTGGFDSLSGTPLTTMDLVDNAIVSDNTGIIFYSGSNIIFGDLNGSIGEGALSILLDEDTDIFGFNIVGSNAGLFSIDFFNRNGGLLAAFSQTATNSFFGFEVSSGSLIRGVSITNTDLGGIGYDNFTFNEVSQSSAVPEPTSIALLCLGLIGAGLSKKKKLALA